MVTPYRFCFVHRRHMVYHGMGHYLPIIDLHCLCVFLSGESSSSSTSSSSAGSQLPLGAGAAAKPKQGKCLV